MNPIDKIDPSWGIIKEIFTDHKFSHLEELRTLILPKCSFFPEKENIFNVFTMPLHDIKVVILGQDPYPKKGQAIGYSFAVSEDTPKPTSLRIIEKEVGHEIDKTLQSWRDQGVFLLNTALTVEENKAGSHLLYWRPFMNALINYISHKNPCIWVLWGKHAQNFKGAVTQHKPNVILEAAHPAAESYKSNAGFIGCNHFIKINEILKEQNKQLINF